MNDAIKAAKIIDEGWITIPIGLQEPIILAAGPLVSQGLINSRRFEIACRYPPRGIPISHILNELRSMTKIKEVILGNAQIGNKSAPVNTNGFTTYAEFPTPAEALAFPLEIQVKGEKVQISHRGRLQ